MTIRAGGVAPRVDVDRLAEQVGEALRLRGATVATAESCTGGLLGALITAVPGSSDYFLGGVVAYANAAKVALLGVRPSTLARWGAVSAATAGEMATGARRRLAADYALSITGVAGPGGGSVARPVGRVFIAVTGPAGTRIRRRTFAGDRATVRTASARASLRLLLGELARDDETVVG